MTSLWRDGRAPIPSDVLTTERCDNVVVGAEITGLTTALLLARRARCRRPRDARCRLRRHRQHDGKGPYAAGDEVQHPAASPPRRRRLRLPRGQPSRPGLVLEYCQAQGIAVQRRDAVTYAPDTDRGRRAALREHEAATAVGLATRWSDDLPRPLPARRWRGAGRPGTARPDGAAARSCRGSARRRWPGGPRCPVQHVSVIGRPSVRWDGGRMSSDTIVLGTGAPTVDRALHFARLERSAPTPLPSTTRTLRT